MRIKRSVNALKKRRAILKQAKGYRGAKSKLYRVAREAVMNGAISTSMIQRNFEVGFNRAGRIKLQLDRAGIVGPQIGSKQREIKYYDLPSLEARLQDLGIY